MVTPQPLFESGYWRASWAASNSNSARAEVMFTLGRSRPTTFR